MLPTNSDPRQVLAQRQDDGHSQAQPVPDDGHRLDFDDLTGAEIEQLLTAHPMPTSKTDWYGASPLRRLSSVTRSAILAAEAANATREHLHGLATRVPGGQEAQAAAIAATHIAWEATGLTALLARRLYLGELLERPDLYPGAAVIYRARGSFA